MMMKRSGIATGKTTRGRSVAVKAAARPMWCVNDTMRAGGAASDIRRQPVAELGLPRSTHGPAAAPGPAFSGQRVAAAGTQEPPPPSTWTAPWVSDLNLVARGGAGCGQPFRAGGGSRRDQRPRPRPGAAWGSRPLGRLDWCTSSAASRQGRLGADTWAQLAGRGSHGRASPPARRPNHPALSPPLPRRSRRLRLRPPAPGHQPREPEVVP
jgi:hypothetical protein